MYVVKMTTFRKASSIVATIVQKKKDAVKILDAYQAAHPQR